MTSEMRQNTGGIEEVRAYMESKKIPQLFESLMTALMYKKPPDHIKFLIECLLKAKDDPFIKWHSFCEPLPPIVKKISVIKSEADLPGVISNKSFKKDESPLPPISEQRKQSIVIRDRLSFGNSGSSGSSTDFWYSEYTNRKVDVSEIIKKPVIFVLGGPGSGKGTQCAKLAVQYGFKHLSAGDLLRKEVEKGSEIGQKINEIMKEGQLVPEDVTICLLKEAMVENSKCLGFLIDGFPREIQQGKKFERMVCFAKMVLYFDCKDDILVERLLSRGATSGRLDDNEATIKKRLSLFHEKTEPVVLYYKDIVEKICADCSIEEVFTNVCNAIDYRIFNKFDIKKPVIFVLGGPGCGKGTQCSLISKKFDMAHISAGDLLRLEAENDTEIGLMIKNMMKEGQLVPQEIVIDLLKEAIRKNQHSNGILIDGFPREYSQGLKFEIEVCPSSLILYYDCHDEILVERLVSRGQQSGRIDDNIETIKKRLQLFHTKTTPLLVDYKDKVQVIDSSKSIEEVFIESSRIVSCLLDGTLEIFNPKYSNSRKIRNIATEEVLSPSKVQIIEGSSQRKHLFNEDLKDKCAIFVIGGPGCREELICQNISSKFGYSYICIGELLRNEVSSGSSRGSMLNDVMKTGDLVSQAVIIDLLEEAILKSNESTFLIHGFPREVQQAIYFEEKLLKPSLVLYFSCITDEQSENLSVGNNNEDIVLKRKYIFENQTKQVIEKYSSESILHEISAVGSAEAIFEEVVKSLETFEKKKNMSSELEGKNIIFVLGGPGSGKGTQCAKIVEKYGFCHLSTGDLLREEVKSSSERSEQLKAIMARGELVSQETILEILRDAMIRNKDSKGFLIDGFPRDVPQGKLFEKTVAKCKCVLYFECTNDVMTERLLGRAATSNRVDDNLETIKLRLKTFEDATLPVLAEFSDRLKKVNAERSVDQIFCDVCSVLDGL
ncbi:adenylate kinase isoenzyme 5 isoform X1 [Hydra vulgaris]|uniref:adenylate kinase isoenzyme 5 isoform X1 n=1 Tax=Hydra vulgaris TaxID=6087 RepID=UPI001F5E51CD|nr:adenylate kinase isoenzyme 5 [Hydra vulgaris]